MAIDVSEPPPAPTRSTGPAPKPFQFSLRTLLLSMVVVTLLLGVVCRPYIQLARDASLQHQCMQNLKRIGIALHAYHAEWHCFPPAFVADESGEPMHSWRVLLLPYLDHQELYDQYRFDETWTSPHNLSVAKEMPSVYRCPEDQSREPSDTSYLMLVGPGAFSEGATPITISDITDGADCTIAVVERTECGIGWTRPRDLDTDEMSYALNGEEALCPRSHHLNNVDVLFADGTVRALNEPMSWDGLDPDLIRTFTTRDADDQRAVH